MINMLRVILLITILSAFDSFGLTPVEDTLPNILWIVSEDNSPFLGAYGDK